MYKSFVYGWIQVLEAIKNVHSPQARACHATVLPTVEVITRELVCGGRYDHRFTEFFFRNGGKVEFALDGLIDVAKDSDEFFDLYFGNLEDYSEGGQEYEALPKHPLDDLWSFVRYHFLGPKGKVLKGPFE